MSEVLEEEKRGEESIVLFLLDNVVGVVLAEWEQCFLGEFEELVGELGIAVEPKARTEDEDVEEDPDECEG